MLSSEISDLEQFIDSYVGPDPLKASSSSERTQSYDSNPGFNFMNSAFEDNVSHNQPDNGAEFWGEKPSGKDWGSPHRAPPSAQQGWHEHQPNIQNRDVHWQQQMYEMSQQQQQQQHLQQQQMQQQQLHQQQAHQQQVHQQQMHQQQLEHRQQQQMQQQPPSHFQGHQPIQQQQQSQQQSHYEQQHQQLQHRQQHQQMQHRQLHHQQVQQRQIRPDVQQYPGQFQPYPRQEFHPTQGQFPSPPHHMQHQQQGPPDQMLQWESVGGPHAMQGSRDPNQIQTIVSNLIRQNHMQQPPQNLPSWIDTSQPPPSMTNEKTNVGSDLHGQEPILHSMTFQRKSSSSDVFPQEEMLKDKMGPNTSNWGQPHENMRDSKMPNFSQVQLPPNVGNWDNTQPTEPDFSNASRSQQRISTYAAQKSEPNVNVFDDREVQQHTDAQQNRNVKQQQQPKKQSHPTDKKYQNSRLRSSSGSEDNYERNSSRNNSFRNKKSPLLPTPEINNNTRLSHGSNNSKSGSHYSQGSGDWGKSVGRNSSSDFYEYDEKWSQNEAKSKQKVQRRKSAADEDTNWRKRDDEVASDKPKDKRRGKQEENGKNSRENNVREYRNSNRERDNRSRDMQHSRVKKSESDNTQQNSKNSQSKTKTKEKSNLSSAHEKEVNNNRSKKKHDDLVVTTNTDNQQRRVTSLGKSKVQSWIGDEMAYNSAGKEISKLHITDSADLTKFIESTQAFAITESKMREVAEILCNKAIRNRKFSRNAAILCDRMSLMMVHGTKFRSVVLNVMQGHYKNRDQLFNATFRGDKRWFGFITFLVEIFLNVRTAQGERLLVLIEPVYNSLLQVLRSVKVEKDQVECFGQLFMLAGPSLETERASSMNELMSEIRDRCVVSKTIAIRKVLLACVEYYSTKWKKIDRK